MSERLEIKSKDPLRVVIIPDAHAPFTQMSYVLYIKDFIKSFKPNFIVNIGDLYDQYNYSRYARSLNLKTPKQEDAEGRDMAAALWKMLRGAAPKAQCFQLKGNHCIRMKKRILDKAPMFEQAVDEYTEKMFSFDGVKTLEDDRSELVINNILFLHGYLSNLGDHLKQNRMSTVVGHTHRGGAFYLRHQDETLFELNCGHIADDTKLPFSYTAQRTTFWTAGFGCIEELKGGIVAPRFVPL